MHFACQERQQGAAAPVIIARVASTWDYTAFFLKDAFYVYSMSSTNHDDQLQAPAMVRHCNKHR